MIQQPQITQQQQQLQQQQPQLNNNNNNNIQEHISSSFPNPIATTSNQVIINFSDGRQVSYAFNQLSEITPSLFSHFNPDEQLYLPSWITVEDLSSFCSIYEKGIEYVTDFMDKTKLLKMSEYFENDNFTFSLISDVIIPRLSIENSLNYLLISYDKLKTASQCGGEVDNIWFDFFIKCLEIVGKNLSYYFKKGKTSDIAILDTKILDELYEKFSSFLISNNYLLTDDISLDTLRGSAILVSNLEMMIEFLMKYRSQKNFFDLLTNEYMTICGEDNIDELNSLPNPTFLLKINTNEIDSYYEEYKIDISMNMKQIVFIVFYRKSDDSFNVAFKLIENNTVYGSNGSGSNNNNNNSNNPRNNGGSFKIITFLSSVVIEEFSNRQINVKSISNNKSMHTIYKINNTRNLINASYSGVNNINNGSESNYITLKIYLKPCFIHSMLTSFLLFNFGNLYNEVNISKISKQLLVLILKNKNFNVVNEDKIVMALLNWLDDEINIKEDILEIVEYIKWENVSLSLFFEFIVKYGKNIASEDIEHIFIQAFENKTMSEFQNGVKVIDVDEQKVGFVLRSYSRKVVEELIKATKKLAYSDIFSENKKLNKLSKFNASMLGVKDECSRGSGNINNTNNNNNNINTNINNVNSVNKAHSNDHNDNNNNNITNTNGNNNKEQSKVPSILSHDISVNKSMDSGVGLVNNNNNNNNTLTNSNKKSLMKHNTAARIHPIASKKSTCKSLNKVSSHNNIITNSVQVNHTRSNKKVKELKHNKSFVNFSINTNNYTTALSNSTSINKNIIRGNSSKQLFTITNNNNSNNVMKTVPNNRRRFIDRNINNSNSNMLMKSSNGNANRSFMHFHNNSSINGTRSNVVTSSNNNNNKSKPKTMGLITQMSLLNLKYKRKGSSKKFKPFKIS